MAISEIAGAIERMMRGVEVKLGAEHLAAHSAPPRIVLVPVDERIGPPSPRWIGPPRCLHSREITIAAHVWAEDWESVEVLLNRLAWALRQIAGASYSLSQGQWPQLDAAIAQKGRVYVLPILFKSAITVPAGAEGEATIRDTDTTDTNIEVTP